MHFAITNTFEYVGVHQPKNVSNASVTSEHAQAAISSATGFRAGLGGKLGAGRNVGEVLGAFTRACSILNLI